MNKLLAFLFVFNMVFTSLAKEPVKQRKVPMGVPHKVIPVISKLTNGSISTAFGATMFVLMPFADIITGSKIDLKLKLRTRGEQTQLVFPRSMPIIFVNRNTAFSWGLFQINPHEKQRIKDSYLSKEILKHELGHGVATDMMGPLILPIGAIDYSMAKKNNGYSSHSQAFIEQAADLEIIQDQLVDRSFHLGLSTDAAMRPGLYFFIQDNKSFGETRRPKTIKQTKQFRFLTTKLNLSLSEECDCHPVGKASGEFGLGDYETRLLVGDKFKLSLKGLYKVLNYKRDRQADSRIDIYQGDNLVGVAIPLGGKSTMDLKGGLGLRASAYFNDKNFHLVDFYTGLAAELKVSIEELVNIHAYYRSHLGTKSKTKRYGGSIDTTIPVSDSVGIDLSINGEREELKMDNGKEIQIDHFKFNAGVKF